jgi:hypothetical protein
VVVQAMAVAKVVKVVKVVVAEGIDEVVADR